MEKLLHMRFYIPALSLSLTLSHSLCKELYNEKRLEKKRKSEAVISSRVQPLRSKAKCGKLKSKRLEIKIMTPKYTQIALQSVFTMKDIRFPLFRLLPCQNPY